MWKLSHKMKWISKLNVIKIAEKHILIGWRCQLQSRNFKNYLIHFKCRLCRLVTGASKRIFDLRRIEDEPSFLACPPYFKLTLISSWSLVSISCYPLLRREKKKWAMRLTVSDLSVVTERQRASCVGSIRWVGRWAAHTGCAMLALKLCPYLFVNRCPHLFELLPNWLVVMWSASNVMVLPNSMQAKSLKSCWRTIRPIIVNLLTTSMEEEETTDLKSQLLSPGFGQLAQSLCIHRSCLHAACYSNFGAWITSLARMVEVGKDPDAPVCFDIPGGHKKRREAADLDPDATTRLSVAAPADSDADADADTTASFADDPLHPPARLPTLSRLWVYQRRVREWWHRIRVYQNRTIEKLPLAAKLSAGGNLVSVRGRCSVWSATLK